MSNIQNLIEIVYDPKKKKLRARSIQDGHWCRFPNKLRQLNKVYLASKMTPALGDHWIAGGEISEFKINKEKNPLLEEIVGIKNKALLKQFYEVIYNEKDKKVNTEMMNIVFLVKKIFPQIDEQLLLPLVRVYKHSAFISSDYLLPLQNMLSIYNEKRIIGIFSNYGDEEDFLEDTVAMYTRVFQNNVNVNDIFPEKPKNIRELHTIFSRECVKISEPKSLLNQKLTYLAGKKVGDFDVFIPETTYDLINIGNPLNICVGNGLYAQKVIKKQCNIIALKDSSGKFTYCIEFNRNGIIQARGRSNVSMTGELLKKLQEVLLSKEEKAS